MEAPRRRAQVSLANLILLCLLVGAVIIVYLSHDRARALKEELDTFKAENKKLRDELGELTIVDAAKVNVIAVPTIDEHTWRWRIYLPIGHFVIRYSEFDIPESGFPTRHIDDTDCDTSMGPEFRLDV